MCTLGGTSLPGGEQKGPQPVARKTGRSRRLGKQIRSLRAGLSQDALVTQLNADLPPDQHVSQAHLSRVEAGSARLSGEQLHRLVAVLTPPPATAALLDDLNSHADETGWLQEFSHLLTDSVETAITLGQDATRINTYDAVFVQGLLQTADYARIVIESSRAFVRPADVDPLVSLRRRRQERLTDAGFDTLTAVLTEATLRHTIGGPRVMGPQLDRLSEVIEEGRHAVHVLPDERGPWPGISQFVIFEFPDEEDSTVAYVDSDLGSELFEDQRSVGALTFTFSAALAQAFSARESLARIHSVRKDMWQ
jgi:hypothetical protein